MILEDPVRSVEERAKKLGNRLDEFRKLPLDESDRREILGFGGILSTIGVIIKQTGETCPLDEEPPPILEATPQECNNTMRQIEVELDHAEMEAAAAGQWLRWSFNG